MVASQILVDHDDAGQERQIQHQRLLVVVVHVNGLNGLIDGLANFF